MEIGESCDQLFFLSDYSELPFLNEPLCDTLEEGISMVHHTDHYTQLTDLLPDHTLISSPECDENIDCLYDQIFSSEVCEPQDRKHADVYEEAPLITNTFEFDAQESLYKENKTELSQFDDKILGKDCIISQEELMQIKAKDLNKLLKNLPVDKVTAIKRQRRQLKNRSYAKVCRKKKVHRSISQDEEIEELKAKLMLKDQELEKLKEENARLKLLFKI